jgi:hypothetical protein
MPYDIQEHKHRFAAWAAGRAASVKGCRFRVEQAKAIIDAAGLRQYIENPDALPSPANVDDQHRVWRQAVIGAASQMDMQFTHGVAAKLINIYFKAALVCGGDHQHNRIGCLHPPIDKVLLDELKRQNVGGLRREWRTASSTGWSNFDSDQYQSVIDNIRTAFPNAPLWEVEGYWQGHQ